MEDRLFVDPPMALQIELSSNCNLRCTMCPLTTGESSTSHDRGPMLETTIASVMAIARRSAQVIFAGYGEMLTNPSCLDILDHFDAEGITFGLSTNGISVTPVVAGRLAAMSNLAHINVSIDSPDADIFRRIRRGSLARALAGLDNLMAAIDAPERVTVSSVVMASTIASLVDLPGLLASKGVRTMVLQAVTGYNAFARDESLLGRTEFSGTYDAIRAACEHHGIAVTVESEVRALVETSDPERARSMFYDSPGAGESVTRQCTVPWEVPFIDKDGTVFACCNSAAANADPLGNLGESSFEEIWSGERFAKFRENLLDGRTNPEACRTCTLVSLGEHPLRTWAASLAPGAVQVRGQRVNVSMRNTGRATWDAGDGVYLGVVRPRDRSSLLAHPSWIAPHRVGTFDETAVEPGGDATFTFHVRRQPIEVVEYFQLVVEGVAWIPGTAIEIVVPPRGWWRR